MCANISKVNHNAHVRIWISIANVQQWYAIMDECRSWFGTNWRCQGRVKRRLENIARYVGLIPPLTTWFEVPDPRIATWISTKLGLSVALERFATKK